MKNKEIENDSFLKPIFLEQIRKLCLSFPGTSERLSHGAPTFFVHEKRSFVQYRLNHHGDGRIAIWTAAPAGIQSMLVEEQPDIYFVPPYVGHLGWVGLRLDRDATWDEMKHLIQEAYLTRAPQKYKKMIRANCAGETSDEEI